VAEFFDAFDGLWDTLVPAEQRQFLHTLVRRVSVDSAARQLHVKLFNFEKGTPASAAGLVAEATP